MKTKKILAILLSMVMMMSLGTVASAIGERTETDLASLQTFDDSIGDWIQAGDKCVISHKTDASSAHGGYLNVSIAANAGAHGARYDVPVDVAKGAAGIYCVEYSIMMPATKSDSTANTGTAALAIYDNLTNRDRTEFVRFDANTKTVKHVNGTAICNFEFDTWYNVRVEVQIAGGTFRATVMDENGKYLGAAKTTSNQTYYAGNFYGLGAIAFQSEGETTYAEEFGIDNVRVYTIDDASYNYGRVLDSLDYSGYVTKVGTEDTPYYYTWGESGCSFNFGEIKASADKYVNAITDSGSTDKYLTVVSTVDDNGYIEFRDDVSAQLTALDGTKSTSTAIVYGAKVRVDDVTKNNAIEMVTRPHSTTSEVRYFLIEPDIEHVTVGTTGHPGLKMSSDVWYNLTLYHNVTTGYERLEITNTVTNETQIFEGNLTHDTFDLSYPIAYGFVTRFAEANTVDYDDLSVTAWNPNADSMAKSHTFGALTLSEEEIKAGEIKATVPVTSHCANSNVVTEVANLVMVSYDGNRLADISFVAVKPNSGTAEATVTIPEENAENYKVKAMLWDKHMQPLTDWVGLGW